MEKGRVDKWKWKEVKQAMWGGGRWSREMRVDGGGTGNVGWKKME